MSLGILPIIAILALASAVSAQGPGVPIERNKLSMKDATLIAKAQALRDAGKLLGKDEVAAAMRMSQPAQFKLPPPNTRPLEPHEIAARARKALVRVGWFYLCPRCDNLHVNLSGGYAITADGMVVTCWHVVAPEKQDMIDGHIIASDADGNLMPVTAVLAHDRDLDTAIIRVPAGKLVPLPVNDQSGVGDAAFVFSDPLEFAGYFSSGIINRYYWDGVASSRGADNLAAVRHLRMNVSTDWAPGSSGAAVLDGCGNAIGHVALINALSDDKPVRSDANERGRNNASRAKETMIVLHEAIPARGVKLLLEGIMQGVSRENK